MKAIKAINAEEAVEAVEALLDLHWKNLFSK